MKLLALRCPSCAQHLRPQNPEVVALRCPQCGTAVSLSDTGLDNIDLHFAAPAAEQIDAWLPLWVFNGRVNITSRQTQGHNRQAQQDAEQLWGSPRRLYLPAWDLSPEDACKIGGDLVQRQPVFQQADPPANPAVVEAVISPEDALKLLEFVVFNVEAARKDWLKDLQFTIEVDQPALWAVPALKDVRGWQLQAVG